jgi:GNAT superfamily N-acetyltransferase
MSIQDTIRIRPGAEGDLESVVKLGITIQELHAEGLPEVFVTADGQALTEFFREVLTSESFVLVAEAGNDMVGYILADHIERDASPFKHASSLLYVHHIAVRPDAQKRGVGKQLMDAAVELGRTLGATAVRLDSWSFNSDAHAFFTNHGFAPINIVFERPLHVDASRTDSTTPR